MNATTLTAVTLDSATKLLAPSDPRYSFRYFGLMIGFFAVIVGTIGNTLTILTYVANRKMRTTFNLLLLNLAVVDFCSSILMLPFHLAGYIQLQWPFGNDSWTTRLQAFNYFCCGYTSIVFLVVITVNRFIGAVFPAKYKEMFSDNRMIWILIASHTFAPILLLPFLVGSDPGCDTISGGALTGFYTKQLLCTFVCLRNRGWLMYMQFTRILFQFIPLILMIILYVIIFVCVHKKREGMNKSLSTYKSKPGRSSNVSSQGNSENKCLSKQASDRKLLKRRHEDRRMLVISVAICVGFMITFLPSVIVNILPNRHTIDVRWHMGASNLAWLNSSLNPVIYVVLNRRFRKEVWRILQLAFGVLREKFIHESGTTTLAPMTSVNGKQLESVSSRT